MEAYPPHTRPSSLDISPLQQHPLTRTSTQQLARPTALSGTWTLGLALADAAEPETSPDPGSDRETQHLSGALLPSLQFESAAGLDVDLRSLACGWLVIYCYPGAPQQLALESHLEDIREHEAFANRGQELRRRGLHVVALSSQPLNEQIETMLALELRHPLLLDPSLSLANTLALPTEVIHGQHFYSRQTLIVREHRIEHNFCPVLDAVNNPDQLLAWMLTHGW